MSSPSSNSFHDFLSYTGTEYHGIVVPQIVSNARTGYQPIQPIKFWYNGKLGFPLHLAYAQQCSALEYAQHIPELKPDGMRVALRIHWPGYDEWKDNMAITDNSAERRPHNLARLAHAVARAVYKFHGEMRNARSSETAHHWWLSQISPDELYLMELRHVSKGSWQPVLSRRQH